MSKNKIIVINIILLIISAICCWYYFFEYLNIHVILAMSFGVLTFITTGCAGLCLGEALLETPNQSFYDSKDMVYKYTIIDSISTIIIAIIAIICFFIQ